MSMCPWRNPLSDNARGPAARREREIERTRDDILRAAARAFAREGMRATMQSIAKEAGFTAASLYSYFSSKDEIAEALAASLRLEFLASFAAPEPRGLSFEQRLEFLITRLLALADARREEFTVFLALAAEGKPQGSGKRRSLPLETGFELFLERMEGWLGDEFGDDRKDVACLIVGTLYAYFRRWLADGARRHLADEAANAVAMIAAAASALPRTSRT